MGLNLLEMKGLCKLVLLFIIVSCNVSKKKDEKLIYPKLIIVEDIRNSRIIKLQKDSINRLSNAYFYTTKGILHKSMSISYDSGLVKTVSFTKPLKYSTSFKYCNRKLIRIDKYNDSHVEFTYENDNIIGEKLYFKKVLFYSRVYEYMSNEIKVITEYVGVKKSLVQQFYLSDKINPFKALPEEINPLESAYNYVVANHELLVDSLSSRFPDFSVSNTVINIDWNKSRSIACYDSSFYLFY